jgi:hypothetical protein
MEFVPIDGENVLTPLDLQRMMQCDVEGFHTPKEAN